jgi:hypothetical protein
MVLSVRGDLSGPAAVPAPVIELQNANLVIDRIA